MSEGRVITSRRNPRVVAAAALHQPKERRARGMTLLEGHHLVVDAIENRARLEVVFVRPGTILPSAPDGPIDIVAVADPVLERLAGTTSPSGPVAVMEIPQSAPLEPHPTVILCGISDPGNAGSLIRTAAAFGYHVAVTAGSADPWAPKVLRSAAGGHFSTPITLLDAPLDMALDGAGLVGVALVSRGGQDPDARLDGIPALLVGNEARGLDERTLSAARHRVTIPMTTGSESLNAAVAGAIAMYRYR